MQSGAALTYKDWFGGALQQVKMAPRELSVADKLVYAPRNYTPAVYPQPYFYSDALVLGEFGGLYTVEAHPKKIAQRATDFTIQTLLTKGYAGGYMWSESAYSFNPFHTDVYAQEGLLRYATGSTRTTDLQRHWHLSMHS
ncbi:Aste57867_12831 [Aphanomyces stellatus]|uniref:Aste57867_12831 protein n=1 Tax=Aphanomyces stellatus TaxID=120398 RepID=A0A485KXE0_9STRA|nr:hypothetical protein As57867_012783 [Aphanomyces stellatus]VFT89678.1 Aste57867_12831 [Aphanomyces stellatus]